MKSSMKIRLLLVSFLVVNNFCRAQESVMLKALGEKAVQKQWEVNLPTPLDQLNFNYAILKDGVVTYSYKKRALQCYGFDNKLKWEKVTSEYTSAQLFASPNGEYLTVCYIIAEGVGVSAIYNNRGEVLRQSDYCTRYSVTSKYLIGLGSRPMVLNSQTGEMLWHKMEDLKYWNWEVVSTHNDKLVVYAGGSLELIDLPTGKRLWQKDIVSSGYPYLQAAKCGSLITLQFLISMDINKNYTFVYNMDGGLLQKIEKPIWVGKSNGGIIQAISEDGQYLAVGDGEEFYLCSAKTLDRVWTIQEGIRPLEVQKFTKNFLAFEPSYDAKKTRVLILNNEGQIKKDYQFNQILDFKTPSWPEFAGSRGLLKSTRSQGQTSLLIPALQIDKSRLGVTFSLYHLAPESIKD